MNTIWLKICEHLTILSPKPQINYQLNVAIIFFSNSLITEIGFVQFKTIREVSGAVGSLSHGTQGAVLGLVSCSCALQL